MSRCLPCSKVLGHLGVSVLEPWICEGHVRCPTWRLSVLLSLWLWLAVCMACCLALGPSWLLFHLLLLQLDGLEEGINLLLCSTCTASSPEASDIQVYAAAAS